MSHYNDQREADEKPDWSKAPEGAEYFNSYQANFYKVDGQNALFFDEQVEEWRVSMTYSADELKLHNGTVKRPQPKPKYEYGVEYQTNGQRPDLSDDVLVEFRSRHHGRWNHLGAMPVDCFKWESSSAFRIVDERYKPKPHQNEPAPLKPRSPYQRTIIGLDGSKCVVDVYRVLEAFEVDSHAIAHSIKKLLAPGKRHAKTREQDLKEAIKSIEAELLLMSQR